MASPRIPKSAVDQPIPPAQPALTECKFAPAAHLRRLDKVRGVVSMPARRCGVVLPHTIIPYQMLKLKLDNSHPRCLGKGSFASVYEAEYKKPPEAKYKTVAVKFYSKDNKADFDRELVVLTVVAKDGFNKHPNLVGFHGAGYEITKCQYYLVLEYMPNKSLAEHLNELKEGLDWPTILKVAIGVAAGVVDLHAMNLISRDIKPSNVLLGDDKFGQIKLSDFGLTIKTTDKGVCDKVGSPFWVAPEVMVSRSQQASDVYSFGVVLLQMLSPVGFVEYVTAIGKEWINRIPENIAGLAQKLLDPLKCSGATPEEQKDFVENVVRKCIDVDPAKRPTMQAVLDKLNQLQEAYLQKKAIVHASPGGPSALVQHSQFKPPLVVDERRTILEPISLGFGMPRLGCF